MSFVSGMFYMDLKSSAPYQNQVMPLVGGFVAFYLGLGCLRFLLGDALCAARAVFPLLFPLIYLGLLFFI